MVTSFTTLFILFTATTAASDEGQVPTLSTKVSTQRSAPTSTVNHSATGGTDGGGLSGKTSHACIL